MVQCSNIVHELVERACDPALGIPSPNVQNARLPHVIAVLGRILQGFLLCFFFQIVFSLELVRSNNSMSVGACAVVDIGLSKYVMRPLHGH